MLHSGNNALSFLRSLVILSALRLELSLILRKAILQCLSNACKQAMRHARARVGVGRQFVHSEDEEEGGEGNKSMDKARECIP